MEDYLQVTNADPKKSPTRDTTTVSVHKVSAGGGPPFHLGDTFLRENYDGDFDSGRRETDVHNHWRRWSVGGGTHSLRNPDVAATHRCLMGQKSFFPFRIECQCPYRNNDRVLGSAHRQSWR